MFSETITIRENGTVLSVSRLEAMIKGMWAKAVDGSARHAQLLLNVLQNRPNSNGDADLVESLSDDERRLLEDLIAEYGTGAGKQDSPAEDDEASE